MRDLPLIAPNVPALSAMTEGLRAIETSGVFSNGGPVVRRFEGAVTERLFGGSGDCLAVGNATLGLGLALRQAAGRLPAGRLALMPAFTFAAAAHAAQWAGLTPLLCDVDPALWSASAEAEEALLRRFGDRIAVIVPYATFGAAIDIARYRWLSERYGPAIVIDAAASLGTLDADSRAFGDGARCAVVFSMHATKGFAVGEGGLIYSGDTGLIDELRAMSNYGFQANRSATLPGLNTKLPEVMGLVAQAKLDELDAIADHRAMLADGYRAGLDGLAVQPATGRRQAMQFMPVLLPQTLAPVRPTIVAGLAAAGIGCGTYFSPHLGQQPWFAESCIAEPTPVADDIGARMLSLPITDAMTADEVRHVCATLLGLCAQMAAPAAARIPAAPRRDRCETVIVGGGPAGTALLLAAAKRGQLDAIAPGLVLVERDAGIGAGRLGNYAITSDSTAETFLTAVRGNPHPELAALADHPSARAIARHSGALGVPLFETGPFLATAGARLKAMVEARGGRVLTQTEALGAARGKAGGWEVRVRGRNDDAEQTLHTTSLVLATGGWQPIGLTAGADVGGVRLADCGDRVVLSDAALRVGGLARIRTRLEQVRAPKVAIIGGSTSALAVAALLLRSSPDFPLALGANAVTLLHRQPLHPFYPSAEAARADGFEAFGPEDICPVSGFVYRLGGFRLEARALLLRMLGIGGRAPDPRLRCHQLGDGDDPVAQAALGEADLIVAALGYRPRALPLRAADGAPLALYADTPGAPLVDRQCRLLDAAGRPLPNAYGIGLAAGFVPWGPLGGEASFKGQANGLWLWQNDVGAMIVDAILARAARRAA